MGVEERAHIPLKPWKHLRNTIPKSTQSESTDFIYFFLKFHNIDIHNVWVSPILTKTDFNSQLFRHSFIETDKTYINAIKFLQCTRLSNLSNLEQSRTAQKNQHFYFRLKFHKGLWLNLLINVRMKITALHYLLFTFIHIFIHIFVKRTM